MSRVAIPSCDIHRRPLLRWDSDLQVICTIKSRIRMCVCIWGLVVVCRVERACINRYYTSSISSPNCLGIPQRIRSSITNRCSSRSRARSRARIARTSTNAEGGKQPRELINAQGPPRSRMGTWYEEYWTQRETGLASSTSNPPTPSAPPGTASPLLIPIPSLRPVPLKRSMPSNSP